MFMYKTVLALERVRRLRSQWEPPLVPDQEPDEVRMYVYMYIYI